MELGDRAADAPRQQIPAALGIDEVAMLQSLATGRTFEFVIKSGKAALLRADQWSSVTGNPRGTAAGYLEAFTRNAGYAKVYAGLAGMSPETAAFVTSEIGLAALVNKQASVFYLCAGSLTISNGRAAVPGDVQGEPVWEKLAGASPRDLTAFFRSLLEKDGGRLAAFYLAVSRGDDAHQRFFTKTPARGERFYGWYRDSGDAPSGLSLDSCQGVLPEIALGRNGRRSVPGRKSRVVQPPRPGRRGPSRFALAGGVGGDRHAGGRT